MKAIVHVTLYDYHSLIEDAYVLFEETIIEVGLMSDYKEWDVETIDGQGCLLMPSLVNGHSHIYSTFARGITLPFDPKNFQEILDQLWWKLDGQLDKETIYYSAIVHGIDSVKNGITTMIDHHASGLMIEKSLETLEQALCQRVGLRGVFSFETSDRFKVSQCIDENLRFMTKKHPSSAAGLFGLHASLSLSETTLIQVSDQLEDQPIHVHISESLMDEDDSKDNYGMSVIQRLDSHNLLSANSLLAHCIHIDEEDARIIKDRGCFVVLNVTSNMNNAVGLPDYKLFKKYDIPVMIGNDGISSSVTTEWLNLYYTMHHLTKSPIGFGMTDLMAVVDNTYAYASNLLQCKLGRISKGYESDMILIPYSPPTPMTQENAFGHVFFGLANSFKPKSVWCKGKNIVKDYQISSSLEGELTKARAVAGKLWERL